MAEKDDRNWLTRNWNYVAAAMAVIGWTVAAITAVRKGEPVPPPIVIREESPEYAPTFGWTPDAEALAENADPLKTVQFATTPAGMVLLADDGDKFLWQAVRKAANLPADRYPNINQGQVGSCVGAANKHGADVVQATAILAGERFEWKPVSAEVIYAGSRVEVGGGRIRGDGSVGAWAAKWLRDYGVVPMETVGGYDLSTYSASRARAWGKTGVPPEVEAVAKQHPVKGVALVRTWGDVDRAVRQGYPVVVCSNQGFTMDRDRDGFASPQGQWYHCMAIIGVRGGARPGGFILNSWGDRAHVGPVWPADAPVAGFWADARVIGGMVGQGDSFALSDVHGFPARRVPDDWFIRAAPRQRDPLALLARPEFALSY